MGLANAVLNAAQKAAAASSVAGNSNTGANSVDQYGLVQQASPAMRSMKGEVCADLVALSTLPAGASFSGGGTYNSTGVLAVQGTGTVTHNATGWYDGTPCLDFTANTDFAELRIYNAAGIGIYDSNGVAFEYGLPDPDPLLANFSVQFDYSHDAVNIAPANYGTMSMFRNDQTLVDHKMQAGQRYTRQRWDHDATDANCGAWPGYGITQTGTGAEPVKSIHYIRFRINKFNGRTVKLKYVRRGGLSTPCFTFGSDNCTPSDLALKAFGYMAYKAVPGYINQYLDSIAVPQRLDIARRIHAAGFEINGNDIQDRPLGRDVLTVPAMEAAIQTTRDTLLGYGFYRGSKVWVANNNSSSYIMSDALAKYGYVANRNGENDGRYTFPEGGVPEIYRLPAITCDNKNFLDIKPRIDRAVVYGCTLHMYWHGILSTAQMALDNASNVTGVAGAPISRSGTETLAQYRARVAALGTAAGNASVTYFDARVGSSSLGMWFEEFSQVIDYLVQLRQAGTAVVMRFEDWVDQIPA